MPLTVGTRLGPYEIVAALGAGGMGEVYKARDTRLGRTVAIKVLPSSVATDSAARERFKREGEAIAAVNDPHICVLYDIDRHGDHDVLVMEYVDGEPLDVVLARGPMPFAQAAPIAVQIASALDAAHRAGIVHRDLKPSNIMLSRNGAKILDFGIAKLRSSAVGEDATRAATLTGAGNVIGTINYMAPEQLQGLDVDARADLFAFGALLFEMLTGRSAATASSDAIVPAPTSVQWLVRRCLEKDRETRWQSAHDAAAVMRWSLEQSAAAIPAHPPRRLLSLVAFTVVAFTLGAGLVWALLGTRTAEPARVSRLSIVAPTGATFTPMDVSGGPQFAISPDAEQIAFVASTPGASPRIWVRSLTTGVARALDGTDNAGGPFWSPDSRAIGFFTLGKLRTIDLAGGRIQDLADVTFNVLGGSWGPDGILYDGAAGHAIHFVPSTGGASRPVTLFDKAALHTSHRRPQFLSDGRHFIYFVTGQRLDRVGVYYGSLDAPATHLVVQVDTQAHFVAPHWLFFGRGGRLVAQRFNVNTGALVGEPIALPDHVTELPAPSALMLSVSEAGTLAFWDGSRALSTLAWVDRSGRPGPDLLPEKAGYHNPALSPDGTRALITRTGSPSAPPALWGVDIATGRQTRLTFTEGVGFRGTWSPDGTRIAFGLLRRNSAVLFIKPASGAGVDEPLPLEPGRHYATFPTDWTPDGERILYQATGGHGWDLWAWHLSQKTAHAVVETRGNQTNGRVSPNGRWLAYGSDESGTWQVYVQPFLGAGGRWQVSEGSGSQPQWRGDGQELFYIDNTGMLFAAKLREQPTFEVLERQQLVRVNVQAPVAPFSANFSVTPDGQRFLINRADDAPMVPISVLVNWQQLLSQ